MKVRAKEIVLEEVWFLNIHWELATGATQLIVVNIISGN